MIPVISDLNVATGVAVVSLDIPTAVSSTTSYELQSYTVSPACAISLSDFGTTPVHDKIYRHKFFQPATPSTCNTIRETCENYLYSSFCQLDTNCEFLPKEHVRVMGLLKSTFQFLQLEIGKCGAVPTLLPLADNTRRSLFVFRASRKIIC